MQPKKFLITGGGGFVGANLVRHILNQGHRVSIIVENAPELWRLQDIIHTINVYSADLRDFEALQRIMHNVRPHVIMHLAAYGGVPFHKEQDRIYGINFQGTINVVNAAKEVGFECFINTGSGQEYGVYDEAMQESHVLKPMTDFAASKAAATQYCVKEAMSRNLPIYTVRPFFVYGNYELRTRLITSMILGAIRDNKICLSSPQFVRDFTHVTDVVNLYMAIERIRPQNHFVFNAGTGVETSIEQVARAVQDTFDYPLEVCWGAIEQKKVEQKHFYASIDLARRVLDWEPNYSLQQGIAKYRHWMEENMDAYETMPIPHEEMVSML